MKYLLKTFTSIVLVTFTFILCSFTNVNKVNNDLEVRNVNTEKSWELVLQNLDIDIEYLEPNKYLGLFWDSYVNGNKGDGYLYLCWTSTYFNNDTNTILEFKESGNVYTLYNTMSDMQNNRGNWLGSSTKTYPDYDLTLYMTPIGGYKNNERFGIELKRNYNFTSVKFGYERTNKSNGRIDEKINFDLGKVPTNNGKNALQLCTHGYEIIKECEAQSYFDLFKFGGYGHFAYFNTTIPIDKIYRVDVNYKVVNDDKPWYEFFLPNDEREVTKSLTAKRVQGGIFNLFSFQGFDEGSYQSTKNSSINYKYKLHLNYDDEAWSIHKGKDFYEADYRRVSKFQVLRMNYVVDGKTYDVPVKMDVIEGDTLFILDPDLILDTNSSYYDFKKMVDDFFRDFKESFDKYKTILVIIISSVVALVTVLLIVKFTRFIRNLIGTDNDHDNYNNKNIP